MRLRSYLSEVFTANRMGKLIVALFQLVFWWQYCNISTFSARHNIFTTFALAGAGGLMANLAWLLYYLGGEFYLLATLQKKLLAANPLVVVRNEKRTTILLNCLMTILSFVGLYNLLFLSIIGLFQGGQVSLLVYARLWGALCLSLTAFTLLVLLCSLVQPILGWVGAIICSFISLILKTSSLTMLTNNVGLGPDLLNILWIIILLGLLQQVNRRIETK